MDDTTPSQTAGGTNACADKNMYYIGIGASAGGLEALQELFHNMPNDTGMTFIVIQHLSPDYKSLMSELLSRCTKMPIQIAQNEMQAKPNTVYLISPRKNLSLFHGKFYLEDQKNIKGLNLPIDIFFRSLASDQEKNAVGIILSGTGSDGTLGIRAIKEAGGMIMVQDDQSAKFDGMPRSSISTGLVDYILPPKKMPGELINYIKHPYIHSNHLMKEVIDNKQNVDTLTRIILVLRDFSGIDFSYYKENTIIRRLERRVSINRFTSLDDYFPFFLDSNKEKETLYKELLIGVTSFFRDREAFDSLARNIIENLPFRQRSIRIWSTACSTGEEVYSLAMLIREYLESNKIDCEVKIFATDIDRQALEFAGQGLYSDSIVSDLEPRMLAKYFICKENCYQVSEPLRKMIVFATHNILKDPPFSKLDLLVCRNLFIYLKPETQQRVLSMFYYSLSPSGYLFMGSSESIGEMSEAFTSIDSKWKIYQYKSGFHPSISTDILSLKPTTVFDTDVLNPMTSSKIKIEKIVEQAASVALPPALILDANDNIIHMVNDVNRFLVFKPGRFASNIFANITDELAIFIGSILRKLKSKKNATVTETINGLKNYLEEKLIVSGYYFEYQRADFYLLTFQLETIESIQAVTTHINAKEIITKRIIELENELNMNKENLQATVEELETSNEELQSSNEELIASNEELQSTNEELQSVNEELYTVNNEYQRKIEELTRMTEDLDNLLKNTDIGALYLDRKLCIRKITPLISTITNIMPADIGRPISHITSLKYHPEFLANINDVIRTLQLNEHDIVGNDEKKWFMKIRPYRTDFNAVDGILVTFIDINRHDARRQIHGLRRKFKQSTV